MVCTSWIFLVPYLICWFVFYFIVLFIHVPFSSFVNVCICFPSLIHIFFEARLLLHEKYSSEIVLTKLMVHPQLTNLMFTLQYSSCINFLDISFMNLLFFFFYLFDITILWVYIFDVSLSFYFVYSLFIAQDIILTPLVFYSSSNHKNSFITNMFNPTYPCVSRHQLCGRD